MARDAFEVRGKITATDETGPAVDRARTRFGALGDFVRSRLVITLGDLERIARSVAGAIGGLVAAATEAEDSAAALDAALGRLGPSAAGVSAALQAQASALQATTRYADDAIVRGQALIAAYVDEEATLKRVTQAAVDLAAAKRIELGAAFDLLSKAAAGSTETLGRYGVQLDEAIPKSQRFAAALERIEDLFGGRAAKDAQTFSGAVAKLGNALDDLAERAGLAITNSDALRRAIANLTGAVQSAAAVELLTRAIAAAGAALGFFAVVVVSVIDGVIRLGQALALLFESMGRIGGLLPGVGAAFAGFAATAGALRASLGEAAGATELLVERIVRANLAALDAALGLEQTGTAAGVAASGLSSAAGAAGQTTDALGGLAGAAAGAGSALELLGQRLGVLTSAELAEEIRQIEIALAGARAEIGANSDEYVRLEAIARDRIEALTERALELADGMGEITDSSAGAADGLGNFGAAADAARARIEGLAAATRAAASDMARTADAARSAGGAQQSALFPGLSGGSFTFVQRPGEPDPTSGFWRYDRTAGKWVPTTLRGTVIYG